MTAVKSKSQVKQEKTARCNLFNITISTKPHRNLRKIHIYVDQVKTYFDHSKLALINALLSNNFNDQMIVILYT